MSHNICIVIGTVVLIFCYQGEILQLSEKYVKALAKETENTIDGPYTGRFTGYGTLTYYLPFIIQGMDMSLITNSSTVRVALDFI